MLTDRWGREFETVEQATAARPSRIAEKPIYDGYAVRGHLTHYQGVGWTHSLLSHGSQPFASPDTAEIDFWLTKDRLPAYVHKAIFGYERRITQG